MTIFNYSVNYFDVIIAGILLIFGIVGAKRGIFITLVNFIRYVVGFFLCIFCADRLPVPIYNTFVKDQLENYINQKIVTSSNIDEIYSNFNNAVSSMPSFLKQDLNGLKIDFVNDIDVHFGSIKETPVYYQTDSIRNILSRASVDPRC